MGPETMTWAETIFKHSLVSIPIRMKRFGDIIKDASAAWKY